MEAERITNKEELHMQDTMTVGRKDKQWIVRALIIAFLDICILSISYFFALMIRFDFAFGSIPKEYMEGYKKIIIPYIICALIIFYIFRLYHSIWRFASVSELSRMIWAFLVLQVIAIALNKIVGERMPYSFWIIGFLISFGGCTALRFSYRFFRAFRQMMAQKDRNYGDERVMIIGAGSAGRMLIHEMIMSQHLSTKVCCIIDDNPIKKNRFLDGVPIVGNCYIIGTTKKNPVFSSVCPIG